MKSCDVCNNQFEDGVSYEWKAGKKVSESVIDVQRTGNKTVTTSRVTYTNFLTIPVDMCMECYKKDLNKQIFTDVAFLSAGILIIASPFLVKLFWPLILADAGDNIQGVICCPGLLGLMFASFSIGELSKVLGGSKKESAVQEITKPIATSKMTKAGRDTLFTPQQFSQLK